jgi:hypothetical protein
MQVRCNVLPQPQAPKSFSEYLSLLRSWDQRLLQHVEILDAQTLIDYFQTDEVLFVVSDGGADAECGSYGALLATADDILVKISGSTEGALPGSFRAESYGCLAIFRFVYHFHLYYKLDPILCRNTFHCDNKGLITRLTFADGPLSPFPRHFLRSDIDLEMKCRSSTPFDYWASKSATTTSKDSTRMTRSIPNSSRRTSFTSSGAQH